MLRVLTDQPSIISHYLRELRDVELQKDSQRFERNLERLGMLLGYELSRLLNYSDHKTTTPLGTANTPLLNDQLVIATILRAGQPVQRGVHHVFDTAELCFIAAGRKPETAAGVEIDLAYVASPDLTGKVLVITDTMLATGNSFVDTYNELTTGWGKPSKIFITCVIASPEGVEFVTKNIPGVQIIACALDEKLDKNFFIVPGLGDAGDLLYGPKHPRANN